MPSDADADARERVVRDILEASKTNSVVESLRSEIAMSRSDIATLTAMVHGLHKAMHAPRALAETGGDEPPPTITDVPQTPPRPTVRVCGAEIKSATLKGAAKTCQQPAKYDEDGELASVSGKPAVYCGKHRKNKPPRKDKGKKRDVENTTTETTATGSDDSDGGGGSKRTRENETNHNSAAKMPRVDSSLGNEKHMDVLNPESNEVSYTMIETGGSATDEATATSPPRPKKVKDPLVMAFDSPGSLALSGEMLHEDREAPRDFELAELQAGLFGHQRTLEQVRHGSPSLGPIVDPLLGFFNPWEAQG
jgi:hypothetical protein